MSDKVREPSRQGQKKRKTVNISQKSSEKKKIRLAFYELQIRSMSEIGGVLGTGGV